MVSVIMRSSNLFGLYKYLAIFLYTMLYLAGNDGCTLIAVNKIDHEQARREAPETFGPLLI